MPEKTKADFKRNMLELLDELRNYASDKDTQWKVKGFIDSGKNIFTISTDTKIVSKILEIHLFPKIYEFAKKHEYKIVLADHQNYYPDISFVLVKDENIKFAVDIKTTYRLPDNPNSCNGFTLGSHGEYFINRTSRKNIQFPYSSYKGHFCLGIIYTRSEFGLTEKEKENFLDETKYFSLDKLEKIISVIKNFQFFFVEKWEIASDKAGSGNTANIGSINNIPDIISGQGMFKHLGESVFDDYWMNYGRITVKNKDGKEKKIKNLVDFLEYKGVDRGLIYAKKKRSAKSK